MPDLISVKEIAELLGVAVRTAHRTVGREGFPAPLGETSAGRVWKRADVERWAAKNPRRPRGRPPRSKE